MQQPNNRGPFTEKLSGRCAKSILVPKKTKFRVQPVKTMKKNIAPIGSVTSRGLRVGPGGRNIRASECEGNRAWVIRNG